MNFVKLSLISSLLCFNISAMAGWSSGGGELLRDQINPWFLANTKTVKYCIQIDEKNFGITLDSARSKVQKSILFWKDQLKDLAYSNPPDSKNDFRLGTQNFIEENCSSDTDLVFQLGTLTDEQKQRLVQIDDLIGVTIRTDYDKVNLKGKGFIYIAPEQGPLKPVSSDIIQNMWSTEDGVFLFPVLIHELGHVFGLRHDDNVEFMSEDFVEDLLAKSSISLQMMIYKNFIEGDWKNYSLFVFNPFKQIKEIFIYSCSYIPIEAQKNRTLATKNINREEDRTAISNRFFGIDSNGICSRQRIADGKFIVEAIYKNNKEWQLVGEMDLKSTAYGFNDKTPVSLWLTKEQTVFQGLSQDNDKVPMASMITELLYKGDYVTKDQKIKRKMILTAKPSGIKNVTGTMDGDVHTGL